MPKAPKENWGSGQRPDGFKTFSSYHEEVKANHLNRSSFPTASAAIFSSVSSIGVLDVLAIMGDHWIQAILAAVDFRASYLPNTVGELRHELGGLRVIVDLKCIFKV